MKKSIRHALFLLVLVQIFVFAAFPNTAKAATHKNEWVTSKQQMYYYGKEGKKLTGLKTIGTKKFYFNSKGVQRNGWQKIGDDYYYFKIANGKSGYMVKDKTVNGIKLKSTGKAKLTTSSKKKLAVLVKAQKLVEQNTKPLDTKTEKLKKMWKFVLKYQYRGSLYFQNSSQWECTYAMNMFRDGHGACYHYGAALAFLANAAGCKECKAVSSGGHGWAEINGNIFDPSWQIVDGRNHSYYRMDPNLSGVGGRPAYKTSRIYVKTI